MSIQELANKVQQVASILKAGGFPVEALRLQKLLNEAATNSTNKNRCLLEIEGLCGVKVFGDFYITALDDKAWLKILSEIRVIARRCRED